MALRQADSTAVLPLKWDPSDTETQAGITEHFEWALDHENQEKGDWCWAACLSNSLTCFGSFIHQADIVRKFQADHGAALLEGDDQRIPSAAFVVDLWRSYGFPRATCEDDQGQPIGPLPFEELAREIATNGPVQIELWKEATPGERHLALICGFRETAHGPEVCVSDPAAMKPDWLSYEKIRGDDPLALHFGAWRRTYVHLAYERGYLRRFFGRPAKYLAYFTVEEDARAEDAAVPLPQPVEPESSLTVRPAPDPTHLSHELSLATYGYRHFRYRRADAGTQAIRLADLKRHLFLFESIPVWRPSFQMDLASPLISQHPPDLWHHQIHDHDGPRYYAHSCFLESLEQRHDLGWRTTWLASAGWPNEWTGASASWTPISPTAKRKSAWSGFAGSGSSLFSSRRATFTWS